MIHLFLSLASILRRMPPVCRVQADIRYGESVQIYPEHRGTDYSVRMGRQVAALMDTDAL